MAETKKKFCPDCGKQLVDGKKHECGKDNGFSAEAILDRFKGYVDVFKKMIKKPFSTLKSSASDADLADGLIILGVLALIAGLFVLIAIKPILIMTVKATTGLKITELPKGSIPYLKMFFLTILSSIVFAFVPVCVAFVTGKITKKKELTFTKSTALYAYANLPIVPLYVVMAIVMLTQVSFLITICSLFVSFVALVCFINYISAVVDVLSFKDDQKAYAITSIIFAWVAIVVVILMICSNVFGGSTLGTNTKTSKTATSSAASSIFNF